MPHQTQAPPHEPKRQPSQSAEPAHTDGGVTIASLETTRPALTSLDWGQPAEVLWAQRVVGNHALQRLIQRQVADPWATADATANILLHPTAPPAHVRNDTLAHQQGGLVTDSALRPRVSAILGPGSTIRGIAHTIRPHYVGAAGLGGQPAPAPPTEMELAEALLVYNRYYLALPAMTGFADGLRLPLPIEIDVNTGDWIVNSDLIRVWAGAFDAAWDVGAPLASGVAGACRGRKQATTMPSRLPQPAMPIASR